MGFYGLKPAGMIGEPLRGWFYLQRRCLGVAVCFYVRYL